MAELPPEQRDVLQIDALLRYIGVEGQQERHLAAWAIGGEPRVSHVPSNGSVSPITLSGCRLAGAGVLPWAGGG